MKPNKKRCADCKQIKVINQFITLTKRTNNRSYRVRNSFCKSCMVIRTAAWIRKNRSRYNAYQRYYYRIRVSPVTRHDTHQP